MTPPELVITAPQPGETVTTRTYRFRGTTEPGCTVTAAGRYPAAVDTDGNWSVILVLNEGGNSASFVAADEAGNESTAKVAVYYQPPARNSDYYSLTGADPTRFPDTPVAIAFVEPDHAPEEIITEFGQPDEGWIPDDGRWSLGDGSWIAWFGLEEWGLAARANPQGGVRLALYNGVVLGSSTVADLTEKWGEPLHATDDDCPMVPRDDECLNIVYSLGGEEIRFSWRTTAATVESDWVLERIWISGYWWPMMFIDNGGVSTLGAITEHCDERGCRVHSDSSYWASKGQVTPFYSWGADCLDPQCDYVAIFIGTAPPPDVPIAAGWKVQGADAIGGLLLARLLDNGYLVIGTTYAAQSEQSPILGPEQDPDASHLFLYTETSERERHEAWEIDLEALTIIRLVCDGPTRADCRPVWE